MASSGSGLASPDPGWPGSQLAQLARRAPDPFVRGIRFDGSGQNGSKWVILDPKWPKWLKIALLSLQTGYGQKPLLRSEEYLRSWPEWVRNRPFLTLLSHRPLWPKGLQPGSGLEPKSSAIGIGSGQVLTRLDRYWPEWVKSDQNLPKVVKKGPKTTFFWVFE